MKPSTVSIHELCGTIYLGIYTKTIFWGKFASSRAHFVTPSDWELIIFTSLKCHPFLLHVFLLIFQMRSRIQPDVSLWLSITETSCTTVTQTTNNKQQTDKKAKLPLVAPADFSLSVCLTLKPSVCVLSCGEQIFGTQTLPYGQYCSERSKIEKENREWEWEEKPFYFNTKMWFW